MKLKRVTEEVRLEETILMGMIVFSDFLSDIRGIVDSSYFTSTYSQTVCNWILDYFDAHQSAPSNMIESIFESKKDQLDREDIAVIAKLFERINGMYTDMENPNDDFFLKLALPFFEKRELSLKMEKAQGFLAQGDVEQAKTLLAEHSTVEINEYEPVSPTSQEVISNALFTNSESLLELPGAVGKMIGPVKPGWLWAVQAPMKRGKTHILEELSILATFQKKRVYFVTMEMNKENMGLRFAKRVTGCSEHGPGEFVLPIFDCRLNQDGSCVSNNRLNKITLIGEDGSYPDYTNPDVIRGQAYKPCTYCRDLGDKRLWEQSVWYDVVNKPDIRSRKMVSRISAYEEMYGSQYIKFVNYPKFSKSITQIFNDYEKFSRKTGWKADIFIVDYLEITAPEKIYSQSRDTIDSNWKTAAGLFDKHQVLGITPTQGSRASIKKALMEEDDTSEDIRKLAHVDICMSINQTRLEKRKNIYRLGLLAHRHKKFDINENALCLWQLEIGQILLDSTTVFIQEEDFEPVEKKKGRKKND